MLECGPSLTRRVVINVAFRFRESSVALNWRGFSKRQGNRVISKVPLLLRSKRRLSLRESSVQGRPIYIAHVFETVEMFRDCKQ